MTSKSSSIHKAYLPGMDGDAGELAVPLEVLARRLGRQPDEIVRLDSDESPYGCSLRVLEVLGSADSLHRPGDPEARELRAALEPYARCARERITAGAGAAESLERLMRVLVPPGATILVPTPARAVYSAVAARLGICVVTHTPVRGFDYDIETILTLARDHAAALIILSAPNDPTGAGITATEVVRLLRSEVPVLVDECFYEFSGRTVAPLVTEFENLIVLRDFAPWAGLGGLPISYLLTARPLAARLRQAAVYGGATTAPSRAAQIAAMASLTDLDTLRAHIKAIRQERGRLFRSLRKLNLLQPYPSEGPFLLCAMTRGNAAAIRDHLADQDGIIVRALQTTALPNHLRVSVGRPQDTDALMRGLLRIAEQHPL
ncbi:MAG TPA: aminotransferase class I/II-fold pyridoxal phosphate-dependent enzyme [Chloroflexia bacterium]|nr:aminotransferase class I/II-fold pyridoxal phosphate-dependent enzyme [Chloroflexia bacterium]